MDIDSTEMRAYGPGKDSLWYSSRGISEDGVVTEVQVFAEDLQEAKAIGQGMAIAHGLHMNRGPEYIATKKDFDECFGENEG